MIETPARVVAVEPGFAWVASERRSACGHCSSVESCGVSALGKLFGDKPLRMRLRDTLGVQPGETVVIGLSERRLLAVAAVVYVLPVFLMIAIALFAAQLGLAQGAVTLSGFAGLAAGLWLVKYRAGRAGAAENYQPVLLRQQSTGECTIEFKPLIKGVNHE